MFFKISSQVTAARLLNPLESVLIWIDDQCEERVKEGGQRTIFTSKRYTLCYLSDPLKAQATNSPGKPGVVRNVSITK